MNPAQQMHTGKGFGFSFRGWDLGLRFQGLGSAARS